MTDTTDMTEAELADYYDRTGDLSEFEGGEVVEVDPGPKDSIVSVRFAAAELEAVERQAKQAGMKLTAFIRASALSGSQVVDLDRLRKVAAKLAADSEEMGKVIDLPTVRRTRTATRTQSKASRTGAARTSSRSATSKQTSAGTSGRKAAASRSAVAKSATKSNGRPTKKAPPKERT